jgi:hypothetical protein
VKVDISMIVTAIQNYEAEYGCLPVTSTASNGAAVANADLTYSAADLSQRLAPKNRNSDNAEIMAVLLDLERFPNGTDAVNKGHRLNPRHLRLIPFFSGSQPSAPQQSTVCRTPVALR